MSKVKTNCKMRTELIDELADLRRQLAESKEALRRQGREDESLRAIVKGTASATGDDFFRSLVSNLAGVLRVRYAFVSEFVEKPKRVRTLAFWTGEGFLDNFEYDLADTPCERVLNGEACHYPEGVQELFPRDPDLLTLNAESYLAIPLIDQSGNVLGHLAIIHDEPMHVEDMSMFKIFGARAGSELERKKAELELGEALRNLKGTQAQLVQTERMAALGELTAGIVHEMNSPIGVMNSSANSCERCVGKILAAIGNSRTLDEVRSDRTFQKSVEILRDNSRVMTDASQRISKIVDGLKTFANFDERAFQSIDVHESIENTLALVQHQMRDGVSVRRTYGDIPKIWCNRTDLTQVFTTLLTNSIQAIDREGEINIQTACDGEGVDICVSDTGHGIPVDRLGRLFDFAFSTKGSRVGISMGLPSVYNIVRRGGGDISVSSQVNRGTEFRIRLPLGQTPSGAVGSAAVGVGPIETSQALVV